MGKNGKNVLKNKYGPYGHLLVVL